MPIPNLIHPVNVTIEPVDRVTTIQDGDMREPVQIVNRDTSFVVPAQIEYREMVTHGTVVTFDAGGRVEEQQSYIAIRFVDLVDDLGATFWTPKIGDRVTELATGSGHPISVNVYVVRLKPFAHYPSLGPTMLKLYLRDRKPGHNG